VPVVTLETSHASNVFLEDFIQRLFTLQRSRSKFFHKSSHSQLARSDRQTDPDCKHSSRIYKPLSWPKKGRPRD